MKVFNAFIVLLLVAATTRAQSNKPKVNAEFGKALNAAGMTFMVPKGSIPAAIVKNQVASYQYAVKYPSRSLEIRYLVMPKAGVGVSVQPKPVTKNGQPAPTDDPFDTFCYNLAIKITGGTKDPKMQIGGFDPKAAKKEFNADKGTYWMIPINNNNFGTPYKFCNMVALRKDNGAYAFIFYLSNSLQEIVKAFNEVGPYNIYYTLKYK
ncbi:hypothetical protein ACFS5N_12120 [Mucilaginibacter ximonensis]|uniref:HmuY protein n=1 Tax=Mucilaginibacter ximonensis TaxID=538021 RepID=A0ABW5YD59_9SPHI